MRRLVVSRSVGCASGSWLARAIGFAVALAEYSQFALAAVVVERRLAVHHQLDGAAHAAHGAQQDVLGVPVHRCAAMRARPRLDVVPRAHHQRIAESAPRSSIRPRMSAVR